MKGKPTLRKKIILSLLMIFVFTCGMVVCLLFFESRYVLGRFYSKDSVEDLRQLRTFCYLAQPAISSLYEYYHQHGEYPNHIQDVSDNEWLQQYLHDVFHGTEISPYFTGFEYYRSKNHDSFTITMKASFEDFLNYDSRLHKWMFWCESTGFSPFADDKDDN